jgi:hypothetical protein
MQDIRENDWNISSKSVSDKTVILIQGGEELKEDEDAWNSHFTKYYWILGCDAM